MTLACWFSFTQYSRIRVKGQSSRSQEENELSNCPDGRLWLKTRPTVETKLVTVRQKFTVGWSVAIAVGATSSEGFLVADVATDAVLLVLQRLFDRRSHSRRRTVTTAPPRNQMWRCCLPSNRRQPPPHPLVVIISDDPCSPRTVWSSNTWL